MLYGQPSATAEKRPEDYIVRELIDFDDVPYDQYADLINDLASQAVRHFRSYLKDDEELHNVLAHQAKAIAQNLHAQMGAHYEEDSAEYEGQVAQGFTPLKLPPPPPRGPSSP